MTVSATIVTPNFANVPSLVVEQYRLLEGMIKIVQEVDPKTREPVCNARTCPTMSAAEYVLPSELG